jgi:hypothetical protein
MNILRYAALLVLAANLAGCATSSTETRVAAVTCSHPTEMNSAQAGKLLLDTITPCLQADGRYDYKKLVETQQLSEAVHCYLEWAGRIKPQSNPEIFSDPAGRTAFYLNAYTAGVLRGMMEFYPVKHLSKCPVDFYRGVIFTIAGQPMTLAQLAENCGRGRDWRIDFALPGPTTAGPFYRPVISTAENLEEQLDLAVRDYISSCAGVRIDYGARRVLFGKLVWLNRDFLIRRYMQQYRLPEASLISAVTPLASPKSQSLLADVPGFKAALMPDDDALNDIAREDDQTEEEPKFLPCACR